MYLVTWLLPIYTPCHLTLSPDHTHQVVAPKKERLAEAEKTLRETMVILNAKQAELKEVEGRLATLQQQFEEKTKEKNDLEFQVDLCRKKLERAVKLIGGLGSEKDRLSCISECHIGSSCMRMCFSIQKVVPGGQKPSGDVRQLDRRCAHLLRGHRLPGSLYLRLQGRLHQGLDQEMQGFCVSTWSHEFFD